MIVQTATASPLLIGNLQIRRDHAGRYCLNDLHQAAGLQQRHRPSRWAEKGSFPDYLAPVMILAYSVRLRGIEVCTLTDAHRQAEGYIAIAAKGRVTT